MIFTCPFTFSHKFPGLDQMIEANDIQSSHLNIDVPLEEAALWLNSKTLHKMNDDQIENYVKQKIEKEPEVREKEFIRNDRDRRKTIAIESIQVHDAAVPEYRKTKTLHREEEGVIEERDSSEEDSNEEEEQAFDSEPSNDYDELKKIVNDENQNYILTRLSTQRLAASRKNTIESIMMKEKRSSTTKSSNKIARSNSQNEKEEEESSPQKVSRTRTRSPEFPEIEEPSKFSEDKPSSEKDKSSLIEDQEEQEEKEEDIDYQELQVKSEKELVLDKPSEITSIQGIIKSNSPEPLDKKSLLHQDSIKKLESKKSVKFQDDPKEELSDFSSILSDKNGEERISEDSLVNLEIEKREDEKNSLEISQISSGFSGSRKVISEYSLKNPLKSEDSMEQLKKSKIDLKYSGKSISRLNSLKSKNEVPKSPMVLKKSITSPQPEEEKTELKKSATAAKITRLPSLRLTESPKQFTPTKVSEPYNESPKNDANRRISVKNLKLETEDNLEEKKTPIMQSRSPKVGSPSTKSIMGVFDIRKDFFRNIFDVKVDFDDERSEDHNKKAENLEVFGAHILRMTRSNENIIIPSPKVIIKPNLDTIEEKSDQKLKAESLPYLKKHSRVVERPKKKSALNPSSIVAHDKLLFMYYLELIGHPNSPKAELNFFSVQRHIRPSDVIYMSKRLGIRAALNAYSSIESDFIWIGYLQISAPMPSGFNKNTRVSTMLEWPLGTHPGDMYFHILFQSQKNLRANEIKRLTHKERIESLLANSWGRFINEKNQVYYYNYLNGERTEIAPGLSEKYEMNIGSKKTSKLKDLLTQDQSIKGILDTYNIQNTSNEERYSNLSNYILQSLIHGG